MVVGAGGVPMGAEQGTGSPARSGPQRRTRRDIGRGLLAAVAALALAPVVAASRAWRPVDGPVDAADTAFDEIYHGRRIQGTLLPATGCGADGCEWQVTVDGRPLHLMRRADGTWLTMVDHYSSYRTSLEATRAAVDELGPGQRLRDLASGPTGGRYLHMGDQHGVRA
ncbi:tyrosinase family oxidase copper chaperone [Streptomyces sp. NPDC048309]|uniref:tyrosinase family oxidase copper chaperone n=1 Tax=unclassified Streptomyces TaxID=2593676 RepID=UPI0033D98C69